MGTRARINVQGSSLPRMKRTEQWVAGYHAAMVSTFTPDLDLTEENTPVYGYDGTVDTQVINAGTLNMVTYEQYDKTGDLLDVLYNIDPATTGVRGYQPDGTFVTDVVRLTKHPSANYYIGADWFPSWNTTLRPKTGDPAAAGVYTLNGRTGIPLLFRVKDKQNEAIAIAFDLATMAAGGTGTITGNLQDNNGASALYQIPPNNSLVSGMYALSVEAMARTVAGGTVTIAQASKLSVTAAMVTSAGLVTITNSDIAGTGFNDVSSITHAHVYFLKHWTTSLTTNRLLGAGNVLVRGRFDQVP